MSKGRPLSCMGTEARSDNRRVTTNSVGCNSPSWRLPIIRMANTMRRYKMMVRMTEMLIETVPFFGFLISVSVCRTGYVWWGL